MVDVRGKLRAQAVRDVLRVPQQRPRARQVVPVEDYVECVVEARKMLDDGQAREVEDVLAIPDKWETRSVSEYSQDKHAVDDEEHMAYLDTRLTRSSSGGDALRMALMRFCVQHGLEKDGRDPGSHG